MSLRNWFDAVRAAMQPWPPRHPAEHLGPPPAAHRPGEAGTRHPGCARRPADAQRR